MSKHCLLPPFAALAPNHQSSTDNEALQTSVFANHYV